MGSLHWIHAPNYKAWSVHPKGTYVSSSIFGEKTGVWKCDKESLRMLQLSRLEWINYLDLYKAFQPLLCLSSNVCLEYFDKQNLRVLQHPRCQWLLVYHIYIYIYIHSGEYLNIRLSTGVLSDHFHGQVGEHWSDAFQWCLFQMPFFVGSIFKWCWKNL